MMNWNRTITPTHALTKLLEHTVNNVLYGVMLYIPMILGKKFEVRIADFTARDVLVVICPACHWTANVAPHVLHSRYHEMRKLIHLQADMKCKRCGAQGGLNSRIEPTLVPVYPKLA